MENAYIEIKSIMDRLAELSIQMDTDIKNVFERISSNYDALKTAAIGFWPELEIPGIKMGAANGDTAEAKKAYYEVEKITDSLFEIKTGSFRCYDLTLRDWILIKSISIMSDVEFEEWKIDKSPITNKIPDISVYSEFMILRNIANQLHTKMDVVFKSVCDRLFGSSIVSAHNVRIYLDLDAWDVGKWDAWLSISESNNKYPETDYEYIHKFIKSDIGSGLDKSTWDKIISFYNMDDASLNLWKTLQ